MHYLRLFIILMLIGFLTACADFYGNQEPAPVFGGSAGDVPEYPSFPTNQTPPPPPEPPVTETRPLEGYNKPPEMVEIKPEIQPPAQTPLTPLSPQNPNIATDQLPHVADPFAAQQPSGTEAPHVEAPQEQATPVAPTPPEPAVAAQTGPQELKPLEDFAPQSAAVGSLMMAANEDTQGGNLDSAVSSIERAARIEPRNPTLYYKLALLRLKQSKPRLAEDLARKAALLAVNDSKLKRHSWLLVAKAREEQGNEEGVKKARAEADKYN